MIFGIRKAYNLSRRIIREAGQIAESMRAGMDRPNLNVSDFDKTIEGLANLTSRADKEVQDFILTKIKKENLTYSKLIIEEPSKPSIVKCFDKTSDYTWLIDPIDGTLNYEAGSSNKDVRNILEKHVREMGEKPEEHLNPDVWGTMIALIEDKKPQFGVIYIPRDNKVYHSRIDKPAFSEKEGIEEKAESSPEGFSELYPVYVNSQFYNRLPKKGNKKIARHGSYAFRACQIAEGAKLAIISKKPKLYDIVAPICIVRGAGGVVLDEEGNNSTLDSKFFIFAPNDKYAKTLIHVFNENFPGYLK